MKKLIFPAVVVFAAAWLIYLAATTKVSPVREIPQAPQAPNIEKLKDEFNKEIREQKQIWHDEQVNIEMSKEIQENSNRKALKLRVENDSETLGYEPDTSLKMALYDAKKYHFGEDLAKMEFNKYESVGRYKITTYYTPIRGQKNYTFASSYEEAFYMNCQGNCLKTASGYTLTPKDAFKIMACPPNFKHGTRLKVKLVTGKWKDEIIYTRCEDRGGAIKGRRLDLWTGIGSDAWVGKYSGYAEVFKIKNII